MLWKQQNADDSLNVQVFASSYVDGQSNNALWF